MYIAIDMGTSNTRLWLCDENGVLNSVKDHFGASISKTEGKDVLFARLKNLIDKLTDDWDQVECIIASGMAGSELGLAEVPWIPLPADKYTLAKNLQVHTFPNIAPIPFLFVPGLKKVQNQQLQDIMRGEETETTGITDVLPVDSDCVLVLPGTHNKVISVSKDGVITDFYTTASGELLHNIITHSILTGSVSHEFMPNPAFVFHGATYAKEHGLNAALFQIRVMALNGTGKDAMSSFLHGCVLGEDTESILKTANGKPICIGGNQILGQIYSLLLGPQTQKLTDSIACDATRKGLAEILQIYRKMKEKVSVIHTIETEKLIAIIRKPDEESLIPAVKALYDGGIRLMEVTFDRSGQIPKERTAEQIRQIREAVPILVGAGTVTTEEEVELAYKAGASFIISPNCDPVIIEKAKKMGLVSIPAAFTPTEIASAIHAGADYIKLFPADACPKGYLKAVKAPLSDAKLLAVGGVNKDNVRSFLQEGFCGVGVGSSLYDGKLIAKQDWLGLKELAENYVSSVKKGLTK